MIYEIAQLSDCPLELINGDPVRPHIPVEQRVGVNARILVLRDNVNNTQSVVCVSFANHVPTTEDDLFDSLCEDPTVATFYTIWSLVPGAGQAMVFAAREWIKTHRPSVKRIVTLSPHTDMARRFHLKNGAWELRVNPLTVNFEYSLS